MKPTQLLYYAGLSKLIGAEVYVKHENHNPTGTFKIRGGVNLMSHLKQKGVEGVITFSTGNHGISVATSASWFGLEAIVVVPENNNPAKNRKIIETGKMRSIPRLRWPIIILSIWSKGPEAQH